MDGGSLQNELMKHFDFKDDTPTKSAFCQQRAKVSPEALKFLFCIFTETLIGIDAPKTFKGYRLLACDSSDINIPYNPEDTESYHQNADKRGYNQLHLNTFFDILNGIYIDCVLEPDRKSHERQAFNTMIDRLSLNAKAIIMADSGYEGYNLFAHLLRSGQKFIIRLKDDGSNGIISTYEFPYKANGEFDCDIETTLTWKQTNHVKENRQTYTFVSRNKFDLYEKDNPYFPLKLRILCIEVASGQFEYLATNLDRGEFPPDVIKELYHYRWGQENSFRDLKYTIDLTKPEGCRVNIISKTDGTPFELRNTYNVAINSYVARGGDNTFVNWLGWNDETIRIHATQSRPVSIRQYMREYIISHKDTLKISDDSNWHIEPYAWWKNQKELEKQRQDFVWTATYKAIRSREANPHYKK